jgi:DNA-binding GntR family transcriptional regulator
MREHAALLKIWGAGKSKEASALIHTHIKSTRDDLARVMARRDPSRGVR